MLCRNMLCRSLFSAGSRHLQYLKVEKGMHLDAKVKDAEFSSRLVTGLLGCRCPGTKAALQALSSRRVNDAFTLFESLMRSALEDEMQVEGAQDAGEGQVSLG